MAWFIVVLAFIYSSFTGVLPGAIINEIIREDCVRTGIPNEASYNAAGGLNRGIFGGVPGIFVPMILMMGKTVSKACGCSAGFFVEFF